MRNPNATARRETPAYDYWKFHGLGNDYLVLDARRFSAAPDATQAAALCDRHRGIGADGILWGPLPPAPGSEAIALRIYNPDGSLGEKSGNGLRIFARFLWERGLVAASPFPIATAGGTVRVHVLSEDAARIAIEMGRVDFHSERIPMAGPPRDVLDETLRAGEADWRICAASVGNPHCVVLVDDPTPELARRVGPLIERHASFPNRTNVQFMRALGPHAIRIEIWERGAGYTQASGTSSCAAAAAACRLGLCESPVTVHMPGGTLEIRLDADFHAEMEGPVQAVAQGHLAPEWVAALGLRPA